MSWYIRRVDSLINPSCPRPYLLAFDAGTLSSAQAFWSEHPHPYASFRSQHEAERVAAESWGPDWHDLVRTVEVDDE